MTIQSLLLGLTLAASLGAQTPVPGTNMILDPDGTSRLWTASVWNGRPAIVVVGAGIDFLEFHDPSTLPLGTLDVKLELAAWGVLDTRPCAPTSVAGIEELNFCNVNSNLFLCAGRARFLVEDTVPQSGFLFPAAMPALPQTLDWHPAQSPYAIANSPVRFRATYCGPNGCQSPCSKGLLYTHPSHPKTIGAVFFLR